MGREDHSQTVAEDVNYMPGGAMTGQLGVLRVVLGFVRGRRGRRQLVSRVPRTWGCVAPTVGRASFAAARRAIALVAYP